MGTCTTLYAYIGTMILLIGGHLVFSNGFLHVSSAPNKLRQLGRQPPRHFQLPAQQQVNRRIARYVACSPGVDTHHVTAQHAFFFFFDAWRFLAFDRGERFFSSVISKNICSCAEEGLLVRRHKRRVAGKTNSSNRSNGSSSKREARVCTYRLVGVSRIAFFADLVVAITSWL